MQMRFQSALLGLLFLLPSIFSHAQSGSANERPAPTVADFMGSEFNLLALSEDEVKKLPGRWSRRGGTDWDSVDLIIYHTSVGAGRGISWESYFVDYKTKQAKRVDINMSGEMKGELLETERVDGALSLRMMSCKFMPTKGFREYQGLNSQFNYASDSCIEVGKRECQKFRKEFPNSAKASDAAKACVDLRQKLDRTYSKGVNGKKFEDGDNVVLVGSPKDAPMFRMEGFAEMTKTFMWVKEACDKFEAVSSAEIEKMWQRPTASSSASGGSNKTLPRGTN